MATKRSREDNEVAERTLAMANYLIFLSRATQSATAGSDSSPGRVYECKTCNRQFQSFQALGGHRASHKKPKLSIGDDGSAENPTMAENLRIKTKTHACSICGLKFPIGQALGGHMRRHRAALTGSNSPTTFSLSLDISSNSHSAEELSGVNKSRCINGDNDHDDHRRIKCLDLNLTPLENGLLEFGKLVPVVY